MNDPLPPSKSDASQLSPTVTLEWLADDRIPLFSVPNVSRGTIDTWIGMLAEMMKSWPPDRPFVMLHDISTKGAILTPYVRDRVKGLEAVNPSLKGRVALVLPKTFVVQLVKLYLRTAQRTDVATEIFFDRETAQEWLKQVLDT
jgi:hypothetical protein